MKGLEKSWINAVLPIDSSIGDAAKKLNYAAIKIVLITSGDNYLEGTITDGDIRRGLLRGLDLDSPVKEILHRNPLVVQPGIERELVIKIMLSNKIHQVPVVDEFHRVVGLHLWDKVNLPSNRGNTMVIMAGGIGARLRPHTLDCPKPLLPVAGKPMLEHIIGRAKLDGFSNFIISINYLGHLIEDYFGDGKSLGVSIQYLRETFPLGTAGALSLIEKKPSCPILITNGDVIADIHYDELLEFHTQHQSMATMAVRIHEWQNPYGVVEIDGISIVGFQEKPITKSHINAGIYVIEPSALNYLRADEYCDMPTLFERIQMENKRTIAYPMHESWVDIGRIEDLERMNSNDALSISPGK